MAAIATIRQSSSPSNTRRRGPDMGSRAAERSPMRIVVRGDAGVETNRAARPRGDRPICSRAKAKHVMSG